MLIFRLYYVFVFIVQNNIFPLQNFETRIFLAYFASNKKNEKFQIFWQNPWIIPFGKTLIIGIF